MISYGPSREPAIKAMPNGAIIGDAVVNLRVRKAVKSSVVTGLPG
jgi:hypothetical protein